MLNHPGMPRGNVAPMRPGCCPDRGARTTAVARQMLAHIPTPTAADVERAAALAAYLEVTATYPGLLDPTSD